MSQAKRDVTGSFLPASAALQGGGEREGRREGGREGVREGKESEYRGEKYQ